MIEIRTFAKDETLKLMMSKTKNYKNLNSDCKIYIYRIYEIH